MLTEKTFRPAGGGQCQYAIADGGPGDPLEVMPDWDREGAYILTDGRGDPVGYLSARHWVSKDLEMGRIVLHASINGVSTDDDDIRAITVRVVTGDKGDAFEMPAGMARTYRVGLAGESFYQSAIQSCNVGDPVALTHEPDNKFDTRAIAAKVLGNCIGYLPRDGWATAVALDERKRIEGRIVSIDLGNGGMLGVVITISVGGFYPVPGVRDTAAPVAIAQDLAVAVAPPPVPTTVEPAPVATLKTPGFFARLFGLAR